MAPASIAVPKPLFPVGRKPALQYVVEEAVEAGVGEVVVVVPPGDDRVERFLTGGFEEEPYLESDRSREAVRELQALRERVRFSFVVQPEPRGLGDAVLQAREALTGEPFLVLNSDCVTVGTPQAAELMVDAHQEVGSSVFAVRRVPREEVARYGAVELTGNPRDGPVGARSLVEKPRPEDAPSRWVTMGRYLFEGEVFHALEDVELRGGELDLTEAMDRMAGSAPVAAVGFEGTRLDTGNPQGFAEAVRFLHSGRVQPDATKGS